MADRELIAAILTAGMLPTLEIPRSRLQGRSSRVTAAERPRDTMCGRSRLRLIPISLK